MRGDRLLIGPHHRRVAQEIVERLRPRLASAKRPWVIAVCGESGSGKSEIGQTLHDALRTDGISSLVLAQDDYFAYPPITNDRLRREDIERVGLGEVRLDRLDDTIRAIVGGARSVEKPLVDYEADRIESERIESSDVRVIIVEGTYTWALDTPDLRIFIDRDYRMTRADRRARNRDRQDPFIERVLEIEHDLISPQKHRADWVLTPDFELRETATRTTSSQGR